MRCIACNKVIEDAVLARVELPDLCLECDDAVQVTVKDDGYIPPRSEREAMSGLHPQWEDFADLGLPIPEWTGATIDE